MENPWTSERDRFRITANFLGVYGPASLLPAFYTERIIQSGDLGEPEDRERLRAFLDIFNHRLFSIFYRCLSKYRYHMTFGQGGTDVVSDYMRCLVGRGTRGMPDDRAVSAIKTVRYAGLLTHQPKSADGLGGVLSDFFDGVAVRIGQCVGRWLTVEDRKRDWGPVLHAGRGFHGGALGCSTGRGRFSFR